MTDAGQHATPLRTLAHALRFLAIVAVEAGHRDGWYRYVGRDGEVIGLADFGASAPAAVLYEHFGITAAHVAEAVLRLARPLRARQDPRRQAAVA